MARSNYEYETSPRKLEPEYAPEEKNKPKKKKKKISQEEQEQKRIALKQAKRKHHKNIAFILSIFLILLAISYRNSLITEKFNEIQDKEEELAAIEKTNGQLEVSIEGSLNLSNIEETAEEELDMQKLQNDQKVYVTLPTQDYTEASTDEITEEEDSGLIDTILSLFE